MQQTKVFIEEGGVHPTSLDSPSTVIRHDLHKSCTGAKSPPSYAEILKQKSIDTSGSLEEDSIEQFSKKVGRKSWKKAREEEAKRLKM